MKKFILLTVVLVLLITNCSDGGKEDENSKTVKYAAEFRGEWIHMDNGNLWYIKGDAILVNGFASNLDVTFTRISKNVIKAAGANNQKYTLFAKRVANAGFNAQVVFPDKNDSTQKVVSRSSQGTTGVKPPVRITNPAQPDLPPVIANPDPDTGAITVPNQIPGDRIEIIPDDSEWDDIKVGLTPGFGEDQNMGLIPLAKGVNHKVSIRLSNSTENIYELYADNTAQDYIIEVENIGTAESIGASYEITLGDDFELVSGNLSGILNTIVPGAKREIPLKLRSKKIEEESKIKEIKVQIEYIDKNASVTRTWDDTVSLKFFKQSIPFYIRSEYSVQGVIKSPRGETYYFKTVKLGSDYSYTVNVPWSSEDYIVAFLGATAKEGSESVYSLGVGDVPSADWASFKNSNKAHEYFPACSNEETSPKFDTKSFMYYLYSDAEQYFKINLGNTPPSPSAEENKNNYFQVRTSEQWNNALLRIKNGGNGTDHESKKYAIIVIGDFSVPGILITEGDFYSFGPNHYIDVILAGNGTISLNSKGSIIIFSTNQKLTIDGENLTLQGLSNNDYPAIYVVNGILELLSGTIRGNTNNSTSYGGGVHVGIDVNYPKGEFIMSGGSISGNTAFYGGGLFIKEASFVMKGGIINGNTAIYNGGGVCFEYSSGKGSFNKTGGGIIYGNDAGDYSNKAGNYFPGGHAYFSRDSSGILGYYSDDTLKEDNDIEKK